MKTITHFVITIVTLSTLFFTARGYSFTNQTTSPENCINTAWPHELSKLEPDPDILFGRLENGFRYALLKNKYPENRTAIYLNINAGSLNERENERGVAHFLEHMVFNGSTHFKAGELIDYFQTIGMSFGGDTNGYTTYSDTVYKIILPESNKTMLRDGLLVMGDYARGALLEQTEIERERGVVLAEMNERDNASYRASKARTSFLYNGTLLPHRFAIGTKQILEQADREIIKGFYDRWYRPDNMVLVMVGDFDSDEAQSLVEKQFAHLKTEDELFDCPDYGAVNHTGIESFYYADPDLGYTTVSIGRVGNKQPVNDSFDYQVETIHRYMAARIINFRLAEELESSSSFLSSARYIFGATLDRYQQSSIISHTSRDHWQDALKILNKILKQALTYGFNDDEITMVKNELISELNMAAETEDTKTSSAQATQMLSSINQNRVTQSASQEVSLYVPVIEAVVADDLLTRLSLDWEGDDRLVEVVGNADIIGDDHTQVITNYYLELQQEKIVAQQDKRTLVFPYIPESEPVRPERFATLPLPDVTRHMYANGTVLNFKKSPFKKNSVSVAIHFGDGERTMPLSGLSLLAAAVVNGSGTGTLKESELSRVLAGKSLEYRFVVGEDSFYLRGFSLDSDIESLFQVLHALILDPGMRKEEYTAAMQRFELMYQQLDGDIDGGALLYLEPFFGGNSLTHGLPEKDEFRTLTLSDVKRWLMPVFTGEPLEINVVGDITESEIVSLTSKYFGALPARKRTEIITENSPLFPAGERFEKNMKLHENKGLARVAWLTDDFWDIKRTRRLHLLAAIIDERLRKRIREQSGASYSPSASSSNSRIYPGYGSIEAEVITDSGTLNSVLEQIEEVIQSLRNTPISADELKRAKKPAITSIKESVKTNRYWLMNVLSLSTRYPQQLDWSRTFLDDFSTITTDDLNALINEFITEDRMATGIIRSARKTDS